MSIVSNRLKPSPPPSSAGSLLINLLPPEIIMMDKQAHKLNLANRFSVAMLLGLVALTSAVFGIRFFQNTTISNKNQGIVFAENKISSLKDKEGYAVFLKQRLGSIENLLKDNKKVDIFSILSSLAPVDHQLNLVTVEKNGVMVISGSTASIVSLEGFLATLQSKDKTGDLVSKIEVENLAKGRDGLYRYSLRITPK